MHGWDQDLDPCWTQLTLIRLRKLCCKLGSAADLEVAEQSCQEGTNTSLEQLLTHSDLSCRWLSQAE